MTILVTGATGNIGGEVIAHLLDSPQARLRQRQVPIRALVRDRAKASHLAARGVELAPGDFSQPETLITALHGIDTAFLVMPNDRHQVELENNFIDAARQAGVRHLVKLSVMGAGDLPASSFQTWHRQIESHLEASGMAWTHLRPNMLMQNFRWFAIAIAQTGSFYSSLGDTLVSHVDARDVAAVAAICLTEAGHEGRSYTLTGAAALSFAEVATIFAAAIGRSVRYVDLAPAELKAARLANGEPEWYLDAELELMAAWRSGYGSTVTSAIADLTGKPATSYRAFAEDYAQTRPQDFAATSPPQI